MLLLELVLFRNFQRLEMEKTKKERRKNLNSKLYHLLYLKNVMFKVLTQHSLK